MRVDIQSLWGRHSLRGVSKVGVVPVPLLWHNKPPQNSAAWNHSRLSLRVLRRGHTQLSSFVWHVSCNSSDVSWGYIMWRFGWFGIFTLMHSRGQPWTVLLRWGCELKYLHGASAFTVWQLALRGNLPGVSISRGGKRKLSRKLILKLAPHHLFPGQSRQSGILRMSHFHALRGSDTQASPDPACKVLHTFLSVKWWPEFLCF